jgi:hypothetical protein
MIQSVAALTMNYTATCVDILQSGRKLPPYLVYKLKVDPSGFVDTQVNFNQSTCCHILPSAIFVLHIQRGMKRITFSFEHVGLYSPYCSCKFSDNLVVLEAYSIQLRWGTAFSR